MPWRARDRFRDYPEEASNAACPNNDLPAAAEQAMAQYAAKQSDGPQWHKQKPAVTFSIGLTIKF